MDYFCLAASVLCISASNILGKDFNRKNKGRAGISAIYNLIGTLSAFTVWAVIFLCDGSYDLRVIPYALLFALCFVLYNFGAIKALKTGSVMLTSLFGKFSLIVASVWGFFFWGDRFTYLTGIGLALAVISILLCLYHGKGGKKQKLDRKWIGYVLLVLLGNGGCTVVQRNQQIDFDGKYGSFFMAVAVGVSLVFFAVIYLAGDRRDTGNTVRKTGYLPILAGLSNALMNIFVIRLATSSLSPSLIYPSLAVGGLALVTVASLFIFKERMRSWQWAGVALGAMATAILSL